jgi:pilus assembly protein CpaC
VASRRPVRAAALLAVGLAVALAGRQAAAQQPPEVRPPPDSGSREEIVMAVGEQTTIPAGNVKTYSEGVPGVVDVRLPKDGSEFVIVALKPGRTSLLLLRQDGSKEQHKFRVVSARPDEGAVTSKENIRLDFYFVELSDNYNHQIGVGWPSDVGGGGVFRVNAAVDLETSDILSATAVVANQPLPRLDMLQSRGWVRISRHAVLITANGNEANFSSGGEVNLAVQGALTAEIRRIEFGSLIRVLPRYEQQSGRIELTIGADVSDLTDDRGSGIPGRTVSRLETLVNLEAGQGVMLAGLDAHTEASTRTGLPLLSQIPVLGYLFGSDGNREQQTQNVLFIVPTVVDVVETDARGRISEALRLFDSYDGDLDEVDLAGVPAERRVRGRRKGRRR